MKFLNLKKYVFVGLMLVGWGMPWSFTHAASKDETFDLKDLLEEAMQKNPNKKAAEFDAQSMKAQIGPSGSYEDPMVAFKWKDYPVDNLSRHRFGMTGDELSVSQKIPFPGKLTKKRSATRSLYAAKDHMYQDTRLNVIKDVKTAYYELFLAYKNNDILTEQKKVIRNLIEVVRSRYTVGKVSQAELLNFQIEGAKLTEALLKSEQEIETQIAMLEDRLGREKSELKGRPEAFQSTPFDFKKITANLLLQKAMTHNFGLKAKDAVQKSTSSQLTVSKLGYFPDFAVMGAYTFRYGAPSDPGTDFVSAQVGMTVPLWFINKQREEVKSSRAKHAQATAQVEAARNQLMKNVRSEYAALVQASKSIDLYKNGLLPLAKQSVSSGRASYLTGQLDYLSLLNLIHTRFQTEYDYYKNLVKYETKIAELQVFVGGDL